MKGIDTNISLIIPVRDRPELLQEALTSVLAGSLLPGQIIVCVDRPPDSRPCPDTAVARSFAGTLQASSTGRAQNRKKDSPELMIIQCAGLGPAHARNQGVLAADGKWIAFLDSDDLWQPEKLQRQMLYLQQRPQLYACQTDEFWYRNGQILNQPARLQPPAGQFLRESMNFCLISPSAVLLRKDKFLEIGGFDERYPACEDFELWLRWLYRYPVGLLPEKLTIKRSGGWKQLSREFRKLDELRVYAILKFVNEHGDVQQPILDYAQTACYEKLNILKQGGKKHDSDFSHLEAQVIATFQSHGRPKGPA